MSEHAEKYNSSHRKERVEHVLNSTKSGKVDASGYEVPGELDTERKTGPEQPKPRKFAKGGKVEGHEAHHHAGRKSRGTGGAANENSKWNTPETARRAGELRAMYAKSQAAYNKMTPEQQRAHTASYAPKSTKHSIVDTRGDWKRGGRLERGTGGETAAQQLAPNVPTGGLYGSGFQPTHAGMMSNAAGLKKGGAAHKAKGGGIANEVTGVRITGDRKARASGGSAQRHNGESRAEYRIDEQDRTARKDGGRAKDKTDITIIIGGPKEDKPPMPPPGMPMPPPGGLPPGKPPLPPAAMGAMQPPGMGGGPGGGGGPPPMPPPGLGGR